MLGKTRFFNSLLIIEDEVVGIINSKANKLVIIKDVWQSNTRKQAATIFIKNQDKWSPLTSNLILEDGYLSSLQLLEFSEDGETLHIGNLLYPEGVFIIGTY